MQPSPSLGPPWLSASMSPPPCGIQPLPPPPPVLVCVVVVVGGAECVVVGGAD
jgi:hypothetical protein